MITIKSKRSAFTLIELLIVIVIIGILSGVVLAVINPARLITRANENNARGLVVKACLSYAACLSSSADSVTGLADPTLCNTASEIGISTSIMADDATAFATNGGNFTFRRNAGTPPAVTSTAVGVTTSCGAAPAATNGDTCRPSWTNTAGTCGFMCESDGSVTIRGTTCLVN